MDTSKIDLSKLTPEEQEYVKSLMTENQAASEAIEKLSEQVAKASNEESPKRKISLGKKNYNMLYAKIRHDGKIVSYEDLLKNSKLLAEILEKDCGSFELIS